MRMLDNRAPVAKRHCLSGTNDCCGPRLLSPLRLPASRCLRSAHAVGSTAGQAQLNARMLQQSSRHSLGVECRAVSNHSAPSTSGRETEATLLLPAESSASGGGEEPDGDSGRRRNFLQVAAEQVTLRIHRLYLQISLWLLRRIKTLSSKSWIQQFRCVFGCYSAALVNLAAPCPQLSVLAALLDLDLHLKLTTCLLRLATGDCQHALAH